jgi:hypothetical protein
MKKRDFSEEQKNENLGNVNQEQTIPQIVIIHNDVLNISKTSKY